MVDLVLSVVLGASSCSPCHVEPISARPASTLATRPAETHQAKPAAKPPAKKPAPKRQPPAPIQHPGFGGIF